ncbi:MAG: hypothetical protein WKG00_18210 [Polyangiaceae bacterium]
MNTDDTEATVKYVQVNAILAPGMYTQNPPPGYHRRRRAGRCWTDGWTGGLVVAVDDQVFDELSGDDALQVREVSRPADWDGEVLHLPVRPSADPLEVQRAELEATEQQIERLEIVQKLEAARARLAAAKQGAKP